ncbi:hypothetical protein GE21DRAFT_6923 [Neurospora crassa]|uniref:Rhodopsin domain-containing protein n=1 Tax=Neurospora crassa (strain ATCC 24698 / 74-OR23-1A / CBS 708.71 / DSM 1257 / FGSC 987) TaxID=367110 RepID=Q7S1R9_NEUCR|nr:hypothetical protein NCU09823 [Neurospora crassa OR74A]EAA29286.1 hypothetical protein NCU09823 [Neurospora crassa OR74A]KHE84998.1 hypothetical protein GE21DRAFT_6923 [Neurospora crassa]|eukprot:XP_958522.1 hypothetical protein NCU09823 [Neurospora crassa OR74A]
MRIADRAVVVVVVDIIFTTLAFITVCFRLFARVAVVQNVGSDDYYIIGSMISSIAYLTVVMMQIKAGLGRHLMSEDEVVGFLYALWATIWIYSLALMFVKMSITVQCYRVFRTPRMQKFFKIYFVLVVIYGLWTVFGTFFTCWPVNLWWEMVRRERAPKGVCMDKNIITFTNAGINIASDLVLAIIPIPLLWKLQIPKKQKLVLTSLFGMGMFASVMSIVRLSSLQQIGAAPAEEQSVMGVSIAIWSCIEVNIAIMCASAPALKPLVIKVFPKMLLSDLYAKTKGAYDASKRYKLGGGHGGGKYGYGYGHGHGHGGDGKSLSEQSGGKRGTTHNRSAHRGSIGGSAMRSMSGSSNHRCRPGEIQVEHEIEMKSVPISEVLGGEDGGGGHGSNMPVQMNATGSEEDIPGRISPAGSERKLVWQDEFPYHESGQGQGGPVGMAMARGMPTERGMGVGMGVGMGMGMPMGHGKKVTTITTCVATSRQETSSRQEAREAKEREMV